MMKLSEDLEKKKEFNILLEFGIENIYVKACVFKTQVLKK